MNANLDAAMPAAAIDYNIDHSDDNELSEAEVDHNNDAEDVVLVVQGPPPVIPEVVISLYEPITNSVTRYKILCANKIEFTIIPRQNVTPEESRGKPMNVKCFLFTQQFKRDLQIEYKYIAEEIEFPKIILDEYLRINRRKYYNKSDDFILNDFKSNLFVETELKYFLRKLFMVITKAFRTHTGEFTISMRWFPHFNTRYDRNLYYDWIIYSKQWFIDFIGHQLSYEGNQEDFFMGLLVRLRCD